MIDNHLGENLYLQSGDEKTNLAGINSAPKNAFLTYYGGKQTLANRIISLIPPHTTYIEPFIGGGAVLAMKPPAKVSIINDKDGRIAHFYRTIKEQPEDFLDEIDKLIYDEHTFKKYQAIYQGKEEASDLDRAVAVWYMQFCFAGELGAGFGFSRTDRSYGRFKNKKEKIASLTGLLDDVLIFNRDALNILKNKSFNHEETFYYLDPPYLGAKQGHYGGYMEDDFIDLLQVIKNLKGKFILSHYQVDSKSVNALLEGYRKIEIEVKCSSFKPKEKEKKPARKEIMYLNYGYPQPLPIGKMRHDEGQCVMDFKNESWVTV